MMAQARRLNPTITFSQGNMLALEVEDESWGGIAAFYSIIHVPRGEVIAALSEWKRTLKPGGLLLLAFHTGDEVVRRDEMWGHRVALDFVFFTPEEMEGYLRTAGFEVEETIVRAPYESVEYPSWRAYLLSRRPASSQ
jgi:ubiquinone/menaquinone biosynthesis C-methylase UbiE